MAVSVVAVPSGTEDAVEPPAVILNIVEVGVLATAAVLNARTRMAAEKLKRMKERMEDHLDDLPWHFVPTVASYAYGCSTRRNYQAAVGTRRHVLQ